MNMAVTIKDIAKEVGVAPSTVSRVINGSASISEETRKKITEVMAEMNYHPNSIARNFANGSTNTIGLVMDAQDEAAFANAFFNRSVYAIESIAQANGYNLLITNSSAYDGGSSAVENLVLEKKVDGIILPVSCMKKSLISLMKKNQFPFMILGEPQNAVKDISWVDINNVMGGEIAVNHLVAKGYQKIAFIVEDEETIFAKKRIEGFQNGLKMMNMEERFHYIKNCQGNIEMAGKFTEDLLEMDNAPDAFLCANNMIAYEVGKVIKHKKIEIPQEIGIMTFDNYPIAAYMDPPLSVVDIDTYSLGEQAASNLIQNIKHADQENKQITISTRIISRESTSRERRECDAGNGSIS